MGRTVTHDWTHSLELSINGNLIRKRIHLDTIRQRSRGQRGDRNIPEVCHIARCRKPLDIPMRIVFHRAAKLPNGHDYDFPEPFEASHIKVGCTGPPFFVSKAKVSRNYLTLKSSQVSSYFPFQRSPKHNGKWHSLKRFAAGKINSNISIFVRSQNHNNSASRTWNNANGAITAGEVENSTII